MGFRSFGRDRNEIYQMLRWDLELAFFLFFFACFLSSCFTLSLTFSDRLFLLPPFAPSSHYISLGFLLFHFR